MGRNAQPIDIVQANGRKHLTKAEIENRKKSEIKVGNNNLKCPVYVKNNVNAYSKWKEIIKIYKDVDFVSSGDIGLLSRYCMAHSEYLKLCETRCKMESLETDWSEYKDMIPQDFQEKIEHLLRCNVDLQLDTAINRKMDMLIKMEDRLFLNPLAKVKNVPKAKEEKPKNKFDKFGTSKSG